MTVFFGAIIIGAVVCVLWYRGEERECLLRKILAHLDPEDPDGEA